MSFSINYVPPKEYPDNAFIERKDSKISPLFINKKQLGTSTSSTSDSTCTAQPSNSYKISYPHLQSNEIQPTQIQHTLHELPIGKYSNVNDYFCKSKPYASASFPATIQPHHAFSKTSSRAQSFSVPLLKRRDYKTPPVMSRPMKLAILDFAEHFIQKLFMTDPKNPNLSFKYALGVDLVSPNGVDLAPLPRFIHYSLSRTKLCPATVLVALVYLNRLKSRYPSCRGSNGAMHRLALASILIASKYLYDDTYDNRAWTTVSCGLYSIKEVNCMERELLSFLDYRLDVSEVSWNDILQQYMHYLNSVSWKHQHYWGISCVEQYYQLRQEFIHDFSRWSKLDQNQETSHSTI